MAYQSGNLIQASDYNTLGWGNSVGNSSTPTAQVIGNQWGVGTSDHGLGQSTSSFAAVAVGNTVTAVQWVGLMDKINLCLKHQGQTAKVVPPLTTLPNPTAVTVGTPIYAFSEITSGTALAYAGSGQTGIALSTSPASTATYSGSWGLSGAKSLVFTQTVSFSSGDAARYFFNAGGKVSVSLASTATVSNPLNNSWTNLCSRIGVISLGYKSTTQTGNSGSPAILLSSTNGGYWANSTSYLLHFKQFDDASGGYYYSGEWIQIEAKFSGTSANGGYPQLIIKTTLVNAATTAVQSTVNCSVVVASPATTYIANSWGTPSVSSPAGSPL